MNIYKFLILSLVITLFGCDNMNKKVKSRKISAYSSQEERLSLLTERVESRKMLLPEFVTLLKVTNYKNINEVIIPFEESTMRVNPEDIMNFDNFMRFKYIKKSKKYLIVYDNNNSYTAVNVKLNETNIIQYEGTLSGSDKAKVYSNIEKKDQASVKRIV